MTSTAEVMDGKKAAATVLAQAASKAAEAQKRLGRRPCLAAVLVGDDPASQTYVRMKQKRCEANGVDSRLVSLDGATETDELLARLGELADDPGVDGILLQHPTPAQIDERAAFEAIPPEKDVDGVTIRSFGELSFDLPMRGYPSCTPAGMMQLLKMHEVELSGRHAVVVGRSAILGKPMAMMLLAANATVTICHSRTRELASRVKEADVVVGAVGKPQFIRGDWIREGAIVLDAGYTGNSGDVELEEAAKRASLITPVPGGVGPMTIAMLIRHTVEAATRRAEAIADGG